MPLLFYLFTSNISSLALITTFLRSPVWYFEDIYVEKWAVVGNNTPFKKCSMFYYTFFYFEKNELEDFILVTVIISGSPNKEIDFLSLRNLNFVNDS